MRTAILLCGAVALTTGLAAARDFPLQFKTLKPDEVASFPAGSGMYAALSTKKPDGVVKEPPVISKHPLYGQYLEGTNRTGYRFRLDEARGDGKGYDRLILDLNGNGDFTDDTVFEPAPLPKTPGSMPESYEVALFGPIQAPADKAIGAWHPVLYAQMYFYGRRAMSPMSDGEVRGYFGQLSLRVGWYLEAMVQLDAIKQRVGIVDGDCNLQLGDAWKPYTYTNSEGVNWYFRPGDSFLVDADGSGRFENNAFGTEAAPFGSLLYLGAKPCKIAVSPDFKSLNVEPWTGPLADLAAKPNGDQVQVLSLAYKDSAGEWQLIEAGVAKGRAVVPPGDYRLYGCQVEGRAAALDRVRASAFARSVKSPFTAEAGKTTTVTCGAPIEIAVEAEWQRVYDSQTRQYKEVKDPGNRVLRINATPKGAGGEIYSSYGTGKNFEKDPPKPEFTIRTKDGKLLATGNLEFG